MTDEKAKALMDAIRAALGLNYAGIACERGEVVLHVAAEKIVDTLRTLRDDPAIAMSQLMDVCGVDYPARRKRFDVVYQLLSLKHNWRLTVRLETDEIAAVPSVACVFSSAGWYERETFDMFGVVFEGHPDLRRILTDYGFEGYPLRRDFPLVGFTEVRYDDLQRRVVQQPVSLEQDYRPFDAQSPWRGMTDVQKREGGEGRS